MARSGRVNRYRLGGDYFPITAHPDADEALRSSFITAIFANHYDF